jgi:transposase
VLTLTGSARIFVAIGVTDMRKSFDTLAQEVRGALGEDPLSGSVFVFSNRSRTRIKVLWFDRGGFWLLARRLERGTFAWPKPAADTPKRIELRASELAALLDGIDLSGSRRRAWYERATR